MTELVRAYINLSPRDKQILERVYGHGWSQCVRQLIHEHVKILEKANKVTTLADLEKAFDGE